MEVQLRNANARPERSYWFARFSAFSFSFSFSSCLQNGDGSLGKVERTEINSETIDDLIYNFCYIYLVDVKLIFHEILKNLDHWFLTGVFREIIKVEFFYYYHDSGGIL